MSTDGPVFGKALDGIFEPVTLPCGKVAKNRLVKAATYEHLCPLQGLFGGNGLPTAEHESLYSKWGKGGWGMVITGNVQVMQGHLTLGGDMTVPQVITHGRDVVCKNEQFISNAGPVEAFQRISMAIKGKRVVEGKLLCEDNGTLAIMQLSHPGRQATNFVGGRIPYFRPPMAPSAVRVGSAVLNSDSNRHSVKRGSWYNEISAKVKSSLTSVSSCVMFSVPRALTLGEIDSIVERFTNGTKLAVRAGFDGVEIHASHGYLISQFMSSETNLRVDAFSDKLLFLRTIIERIRAIAPAFFVIGIKLSASDYAQKSMAPRSVSALEHTRIIASWGLVDFLEVSGGDYENPDFMAKPSGTTRQALFERFSQEALQAISNDAPQKQSANGEEKKSSQPRALVLLTGGLRTRSQMISAIQQNHADLLGLARTAIIYPDLPTRLQSDHIPPFHGSQNLEASITMGEPADIAKDAPLLSTPYVDPSPNTPTWFPRLIGAGVGVAWYTIAIHRLARDKTPPPSYANSSTPDLVNILAVLLEMWTGLPCETAPMMWNFLTFLLYSIPIVVIYLKPSHPRLALGPCVITAEETQPVVRVGISGGFVETPVMEY